MCEVLSHFSLYHDAVVFLVREGLAAVFFAAVVVFRVAVAVRRIVFGFAAGFLATGRVVFDLASTTC